MSQLRIGIIGCGGIANAKHLPALANMNDLADMTAFCDIIPERAELAAKQYGAAGAKTYTDYRHLLDDPSIDVVHVLTPNSFMQSLRSLRWRRASMSCARSRWRSIPGKPRRCSMRRSGQAKS